ncbi:MAG: SRPBCC family protein [Reyranella sp.]|nr:SRPBCC family protein [Reyranella sp.]
MTMTDAAASPSPVAPHWQTLFQRLLAEMDERASPDWQADEAGLDPTLYIDPTRFEHERERLFRRLPLCLGPVDQLREPGSVMAREICGVPVLITRTREGNAKVFLNVCRHRGARLVIDEGEPCRRQSLVCPYHGWTYRLDGSLAGLPRAEAFPTIDKHMLGLRELPSAVRHGMIWAVLDPSAPAPDIAAFLGPLDRDLAAIDLGGHRFYRQHAIKRAANWKLIVEAFLEIYHLTRLHAGTIGPFFADAVSVSDAVGPHIRFLAARERTAEIRELPPERWSPQHHGTLVHFVMPSSLFIYHPDYISHLGLFPSAPDETLFVHSMLTPDIPEDDKTAAHWARSFELIDGGVFNSEDLPTCEQIQRGMGSGANERLIVGRLEQNLRRFHASLDAALG